MHHQRRPPLYLQPYHQPTRSPRRSTCVRGGAFTSSTSTSLRQSTDEVVRSRLGMNPHWQNIDNETPEDWMWPLSLFRNPSLIRQHRRWRADVPTRDSIASILDDVAQSLEPWCVLSWRPASLSNAIMDPPRQCFQYPPLSIDSPLDSNPGTSYHLTRCMPLKCNESIRAEGSRPATSYVHHHRYGYVIDLGVSNDDSRRSIRMGGVMLS